MGSQPGHEKANLFQRQANSEETQTKLRTGKSQEVKSSGSVCRRNEAKV